MAAVFTPLSALPFPRVPFFCAKSINPHLCPNPLSSLPFLSHPKKITAVVAAAESTDFDFDFDFSDLEAEGDEEVLLEEEDDDEEDDEGSPWEGAVVYRRDSSVSYVEYCTTLERLGLGRLSTEVSRNRASDMGLRIVGRRPGAIDPDLAGGTPVLVSVDVSRGKRWLLLEGVVRTVITLGCYRCGKASAESVFSKFTLQLSEDPIEEEPDSIDKIFAKDTAGASFVDVIEEDGEKFRDIDDKLYFPAQAKEMDISKHIRDTVHLEITLDAVCDPDCKGVCLNCGADLNEHSCRCKTKKQENQRGGLSALRNLKKQMQMG